MQEQQEENKVREKQESEIESTEEQIESTEDQIEPAEEQMGVTEADIDEILQTEQKEEEKEQQDEAESIEELKEQLNRFKEDLQRERAEFINYRKRTSQEKVDMENSIVARVLDSALPVLDSFDRLLSSNEQSKKAEQSLTNFLQGTELIRKQLMEVFRTYGVEEFNPVDQEFDPDLMEALHSEESNEVNAEIVSSVYQKGYLINKRLLRAARVAVLKPVSSEKEDQQNEK